MDKTPKPENHSKPLAIGIDLGTTYSCVAVYQHGNVTVIANAEGDRLTPSAVAFTNDEHFIGKSAIVYAIENPTNALFGIKRIIGRKFHDDSLQSDIKGWPFRVVCDGDRPKIEVLSKNEKKLLAPEEISAMVLTYMKESAEALLEQKVTDAVITVPASFNDSQRKATIDAGKIAGLNVLRIMNEPTAGALAYAIDKKVASGRYVMVFDLGGGTFDVSILRVKDGNFEVKVVAGDTHLGGEDFNDRLQKAIVSDFKRKFRKDITNNVKAMSRLRKACEQAKRDLSISVQTSIFIDALMDGNDFKTSITRSRFEDLNEDLFQKAIDIVMETLERAKLETDDIDDVVLVGGSTRIPKIQTLLQDLFGAGKLTKGINPDEAVASGAAIQAAKLVGDISDGIRDLLLLDVTPLSLGIETDGGYATVLIKRNTTIPTTITKKFPTSEDNQDAVSINIYEGEHAMFIENNHLGNFILHDIPAAPIGVVEVEVTFDIDHNGTLTVSAVETSTGVKNKIQITNDQGRLSREEVVRMRHDAKKCQDENKKQQHVSLARSSLNEFIGSIEAKVDQNSNHIALADKKRIKGLCEQFSEWLEDDKPKVLQEFDDKRKKLEQTCNPIFRKLGL